MNDLTIEDEYDLNRREVLAQELGQITAIEDRCVVFPNLYESKLEPFRLKDATKCGTLGMLTFLLVGLLPVDEPVLSTASVPPQQAQWIQQERTRLLAQSGLPEFAVARISPFVCDGMMDEEAQQFRSKVVAERTRESKGSDEVWYHISEEGK